MANASRSKGESPRPGVIFDVPLPTRQIFLWTE
jgi:hypothetical protein